MNNTFSYKNISSFVTLQRCQQKTTTVFKNFLFVSFIFLNIIFKYRSVDLRNNFISFLFTFIFMQVVSNLYLKNYDKVINAKVKLLKELFNKGQQTTLRVKHNFHSKTMLCGARRRLSNKSCSKNFYKSSVSERLGTENEIIFVKSN